MSASVRTVRTVAALLVAPAALTVALSGCTASAHGSATKSASPSTQVGAPAALTSPRPSAEVPPASGVPAPKPAPKPGPVPHIDRPWDAGLDFGFLTAARIDRQGRLVVTFDRAQMLSGKAYDDYVAKHGRPENDYVIVNASHRLRTFRVSGSATLYGNQILGPANGTRDRIVSPARIVSRLRASGVDGVPVWLRHTDGPDGPVVYLAEQYLP
jgi:hypothetical protein